MAKGRRKATKRKSRPAKAPEPPPPTEFPEPQPPSRVASGVLVAIIILFVVLSVACAIRTPMHTAPDELHHIEYVKHLVSERSFPVLSADSMAGYEAHQPPAYYLLGAVVWVASYGSEYALRMLNTVIGVLLLICAFRLAREALPQLGEAVALGVTGFCAFLPMHLYLLSVVSNDALANLLATWALLRLARSARRGHTLWGSALTGLIIGLAMLTKSTAIPLVAVGVMVVVLTGRARGESARDRLAHSVALILAAGAVFGPWLVRNMFLYGDPLAMKAFNDLFLPTRVTPEKLFPGVGAAETAYWTQLVAPFTWWSFLGGFGHLTDLEHCLMPQWAYKVFAVAAILAVVGLFLLTGASRESTTELPPAQRLFLGSLLVGILLVLVGYIQFNVTYFQAQARYLFVMLPAIALFFVVGIWRVFPRPARTAAVAVLVAYLALVSVLAVALWIPLSS